MSQPNIFSSENICADDCSHQADDEDFFSFETLSPSKYSKRSTGGDEGNGSIIVPSSGATETRPSMGSQSPIGPVLPHSPLIPNSESSPSSKAEFPKWGAPSTILGMLKSNSPNAVAQARAIAEFPKDLNCGKRRALFPINYSHKRRKVKSTTVSSSASSLLCPGIIRGMEDALDGVDFDVDMDGGEVTLRGTGFSNTSHMCNPGHRSPLVS